MALSSTNNIVGREIGGNGAGFGAGAGGGRDFGMVAGVGSPVFDEKGGGMMDEAVSGALCAREDSFAVMVLLFGSAGGDDGKGNSFVCSTAALDVGDSIAFRAFSLSAAMRELSKISFPRRPRESSSKPLLKSVPLGDIASPLGVGRHGWPSIQLAIARASFSGPMGFAT